MKRNPESCRPALHWPGGKSELLKYLLPIVGGTPHDLYCEPFAGGLAVLCAKKRSRYEIVNDLDGDVVNFYRIVKYHCEAFLSECEMVPNSRELGFDHLAIGFFLFLAPRHNRRKVNFLPFNVFLAQLGIIQQPLRDLVRAPLTQPPS